MKKITLTVLVLFFHLVNVVGQEVVEDKPLLITDRTYCETTTVELHNLALDFNENASKDSSLIIIGRSAKGEKSFYNSKRILAVVNNLAGTIEKERIISATATPIDDFAHVDVYLNGRLRLSMRTKAKRSVCIGV